MCCVPVRRFEGLTVRIEVVRASIGQERMDVEWIEADLRGSDEDTLLITQQWLCDNHKVSVYSYGGDGTGGVNFRTNGLKLKDGLCTEIDHFFVEISANGYVIIGVLGSFEMAARLRAILGERPTDKPDHLIGLAPGK